MEKADLEKQCTMYALVAQMNACMAKVEGMKAENAVKTIQQEYPNYSDDCFSIIANELKEISKKLDCLTAKQ